MKQSGQAASTEAAAAPATPATPSEKKRRGRPPKEQQRDNGTPESSKEDVVEKSGVSSGKERIGKKVGNGVRGTPRKATAA